MTSTTDAPAITRRGRRRLARLRNAFRGRCFYCEAVLTLPTEHGSSRHTRVTRDHLIPKSKGGPRNLSNTVAACNTCNGLRSNLPWLDFYVLIRLRLAYHPANIEAYLSATAPLSDPRGVLRAKHHAFPCCPTVTSPPEEFSRDPHQQASLPGIAPHTGA